VKRQAQTSFFCLMLVPDASSIDKQNTQTVDRRQAKNQKVVTAENTSLPVLRNESQQLLENLSHSGWRGEPPAPTCYSN